MRGRSCPYFLQDQLHTAVTALEDWRGAIREGTGGDSKVPTDPAALSVELRRLRAAAEKQQQQGPTEELSTIKQRERALQMQLAERNLENIELRRQAHAAQQCSDPKIAQVCDSAQHRVTAPGRKAPSGAQIAAVP